MPAVSPESDLLPHSLSYRPDLGVLTVRWLRDVSFEELQAGFFAAAELAQSHRASYWLVDVRRRTLLDVFQSEWIAQQQLPKLAAALAPAPLCIAYLLAPARLGSIHLPSALLSSATPMPAQSAAYKLRTFAEEGRAMAWLLEQREASQH